MITLNGSSAVCYGNEYQLICNHTDLTQSNIFLKTVYWKKNRSDLTHDAMERGVTINSTTSALNITVTRENFINGENVYNCYIVNNNTKNEVLSNDLELQILG